MYRVASPPPPEPPAPKPRRRRDLPRGSFALLAGAAIFAAIVWVLPDIGFRGHDGAVIAVPELLGIACMVHLWRTRAPRWKRLLWTPVLFLPLLGPILYGALFRPPSVQAGGLRAGESL
jgi:hypothetical protein